LGKADDCFDCAENQTTCDPGCSLHEENSVDTRRFDLSLADGSSDDTVKSKEEASSLEGREKCQRETCEKSPEQLVGGRLEAEG
jgi:hypothetical protein